MKIDLMNRISNAAVYGYYDESHKRVVVWFYNKDKPDVVAYLNQDLSWDVREKIDETSELKDDREIVIITHNKIKTEDKDDSFDQLIRSVLSDTINEVEDKMEMTEGFERLKEILHEGY